MYSPGPTHVAKELNNLSPIRLFGSECKGWQVVKLVVCALEMLSAAIVYTRLSGGDAAKYIKISLSGRWSTNLTVTAAICR